jgi:hypothetical protein
MTAYDVLTNPFPGLRPFESNEDHLFFGRDGQSDELLRRLRRSRFLAVLGTSGSGKSSLVRAGLLPSLYGGLMMQAGSGWRVALFRPSQDPIANLARALNAPNVFGSGVEHVDVQRTITEATLRRSALGLVETTRQARMPSNENLLVVVDQFEEIFRFRRTSRKEGPEDEAAAFIKLLLEAKRQTEVPIYIVMTMRSDFLGDCSQFRDLPEAINDGQYLIPRMTRDQRREAISGPVAVGGAEISGRLVNRLLNDVGDDPDHLPILQHALMRTWDFWIKHRSDGEPIDLRHYDAVGTMSDALSRHADEAYNELPDERSRAVAEKLFKGLTEKGPDNREIRRPSRVKEICAITEASTAEVIAVIEPFRLPGRSFLMPPANVTLGAESLIDISHESLIRGWERLREWVDEEARSAQIYRRLAETAALHAEGKAGLWHDPDLALALKWREDNKPNAVWAQHYHPDFDAAMAFLDGSVEARDAAIAEKERQRKQEMRRTRIFATVLGVAFLMSLVFGLFANTQRVKANAQTELAKAARNEALNLKQIAEQQKGLAEQKAQEAETARQKESEQKGIAEGAKRSAQKQAEIAERRRTEALAASQRAREAQGVAEQRRREAERAALESTRAAIVARKQGLDYNFKTTTLADRLIELSSPEEGAYWRNYKATALTQLGRHRESRDESAKVLDTFGDNFDALTNRGYMNLIDLKPNDALRDFEGARDLDPQNALAHLNMGVTQANLKDYAGAESSIEKAIEWYRPFYFDGVFDSEVSDDITKATHRSVIYAYGNEFYAALYYELANLEAFRGGLKFEAKLAAADRQAEGAASLVEGYLTALNWAWLQLRKEPGDYGAFAVQAHLWRKAGYDNWAKYYFLRFQCEHQKRNDPRYDALAKWVTRQLKELPRNLPQVDCSTPPNSKPDNRTRVFEVDALVSAGRYDEALSLLDSGIQEDPGNMDLLLSRARYRKWRGDWEAAKSEAREKYYEGSRRDFAAALKLAEQDASYASYKPVVYYFWADFGPELTTMNDAQRRNYLEKALELGPANAYALSELSALLAKTDPHKAIDLLKRSLKLDPTADNYYRLAKLLDDSGRNREALQSIGMAISLQSDNPDYYKERERAEAGIGVSEIERKRHLATGQAEIGDTRLRQSKIADAYTSYKASLQVLTDLAMKGKNKDVSADVSVVKGKIGHLWEIAKSKTTLEAISGRILTTMKDSPGESYKVIIDRGSDDGLMVGTEGGVYSAYSKTADHEREIMKIGTAKVVEVEPRRAIMAISMNNPIGDGLVRMGDLVSISSQVPQLPERSVLWTLIADFHVTLTSENGDRLFNDYRELYADETPELVGEKLDAMVNDLQAAAMKPAGSEMSGTIETGRFKGKTVRELMEKVTRQDVMDMLQHTASEPAIYVGGDWKIGAVYAKWLLRGAPK